MADLRGPMTKVYQGLKNGKRIGFSVEHPIVTAPRNPEFVVNNDGNKIWQLGRYLDEGPQTREWLGAEKAVKQHRTIGTYFGLLVETGFEVKAVDE